MKRHKPKNKWILIASLMLLVIILAIYPSGEHIPIRYIDRATGDTLTEEVAGEEWLIWLYNNPFGEATLWTFAKRKFVSSIYGKMMDRPSSAEKIQPFVEQFNIDLSIATKQEFISFNDFFTRDLIDGARPLDTLKEVIISPADGKVLAYADISNTDFIIKGKRFDVSSFLANPQLAEQFQDGSLMIVRLAPNDYHRFHFPADGFVSENFKIDGDFYSVNPIALRKMADIFFMNKREYVVLTNPDVGKVIMAEVGATMVGSIIQTYSGDEVSKGEEKGYFEFGGSTVVLLFEKGKIIIDLDLLINTTQGLETSVKVGERIGVSIQRSQE